MKDCVKAKLIQVSPFLFVLNRVHEKDKINHSPEFEISDFKNAILIKIVDDPYKSRQKLYFAFYLFGRIDIYLYFVIFFEGILSFRLPLERYLQKL
jgi:hypothetical protein